MGREVLAWAWPRHVPCLESVLGTYVASVGPMWAGDLWPFVTYDAISRGRQYEGSFFGDPGKAGWVLRHRTVSLIQAKPELLSGTASEQTSCARLCLAFVPSVDVVPSEPPYNESSLEIPGAVLDVHVESQIDVRSRKRSVYSRDEVVLDWQVHTDGLPS